VTKKFVDQKSGIMIDKKKTPTGKEVEEPVSVYFELNPGRKVSKRKY